MQIIVTETDDFATVGAELITSLVRAKPSVAIAVATGNTPMGVYKELAARRQAGQFDASQIRAFQLDSYLGIPDDDQRSLYRWMRESFLEPLAIQDSQVVRFPANPSNPAQACRDYDRALAQVGGFDLAILGLGLNGHLGFNEPPTAADAPTRLVTLTPASIESNAAYWGDQSCVPRQALTAGMQPLLKARHIVLLVTGAHKQAILHRTMKDPATPDVPASYLWHAAQVTIVVDRMAWGAEAPYEATAWR